MEQTKQCTWTLITNFPCNKTKIECGHNIEDDFSGGFRFCPWCGKPIKRVVQKKQQ